MNYKIYQNLDIDIDKLKEETYRIMEKAKGHDGQIMLQGIEGKDWKYGIGRITDYEEKEGAFTHLLWSAPTINTALHRLGMYRSRLMIRKRSVYSWHQDWSPRMHIPVVSNHEKNFMVIEDEVIRMPADGRAVWVDTRKFHTYVNTEEVERIHIVGCI